MQVLFDNLTKPIYKVWIAPHLYIYIYIYIIVQSRRCNWLWKGGVVLSLQTQFAVDENNRLSNIESVLGWVQEGGWIELWKLFCLFEIVKTIFTNWKDLTNLNDGKYNVQRK